MSEKSIGKNALYSFMKAFVSFAIPLITFPYASRILLPEGIGKNSFALSIIYYFTTISNLGIMNYGTREAAKIKNDKEKLTKFCKELLTINLISIFVAYAGFLIVLFKIPKLYDYRNILLVFSTYIIFGPLSMEWLYNALEEFKFLTIRQFIFQVLGLIYLFVFVRTKDDSLHYAIFGAIGGTGSYICNLIHARKLIYVTHHYKLELKKHIKYVFTFFGMSVVTVINSYIDSTTLGFLSTNTEVGYYSAATKISTMCISLISAATLVLLPRFSAYISENREDDFKQLSKKSLNLITLLAIPMTFGLISLSKQIILIFSGESYLPALNSMCVMAPVVTMLGISFFTGTQVLPSINKEKVSLISYIVAAVSNILFNILLIPKFGAFGASIATLAVETIVMMIQFIYLRKLLFSKQFVIHLLQVIIASVIMFTIIKVYLYFIDILAFQIIGGILIGITVYFLVLLLFKNDSLKFLIEKIKNILNKKKTN